MYSSHFLSMLPSVFEVGALIAISSFLLCWHLKDLPQRKKVTKAYRNKHVPFISFFMNIWGKKLKTTGNFNLNNKKTLPEAHFILLPWQSGLEYAIFDSSKTRLAIVLPKSKLAYYSNLIMLVFLGLFLGPLLLYWCLWQGGTYILSYNIS